MAPARESVDVSESGLRRKKSQKANYVTGPGWEGQGYLKKEKAVHPQAFCSVADSRRKDWEKRVYAGSSR